MNFLSKEGLKFLWDNFKILFALKDDIPTNVSELNNDSQFITQESIDNHDISNTAHNDIRLDIDEARVIAEGRSRAKVFATYEDMISWLSIAENKESLNIGDNLFIVDLGTPDYWWTGNIHQILETEKVDLTDFYTREQINGFLADKATVLNLNNHINDKNNPHSTTALQIGAATAAQGAKADTALQSIFNVKNIGVQDMNNMITPGFYYGEFKLFSGFWYTGYVEGSNRGTLLVMPSYSPYYNKSLTQIFYKQFDNTNLLTVLSRTYNDGGWTQWVNHNGIIGSNLFSGMTTPEIYYNEQISGNYIKASYFLSQIRDNVIVSGTNEYSQMRFMGNHINDAFYNTLIGSFIKVWGKYFSRNVMLGDNLKIYAPNTDFYVSNNILIGQDISLHEISEYYGTNNNVLIGSQILNDSGGWNNVMIGYNLARSTWLSYSNVLIGGSSGLYISSRNVYVGDHAASYNSNSDNVAIGYLAGTYDMNWNTIGSYGNTVALGANSKLTGHNQVQLGNEYSTVYAQKAMAIRSDERDKTDIKELQYDPLEFLMKLKPVQYRLDPRSQYTKDEFITEDEFIIMNEDEQIYYKPYIELQKTEDGEELYITTYYKKCLAERDGSKAFKRIHNGLIAQDVSKVLNEMGYDFAAYQDHSVNGGCDVLTLSYEEFIAPLIGAVQKQQSKINEQDNMIKNLLERVIALEGCK